MESMIIYRWTINFRGLTLKKKVIVLDCYLMELYCLYGKELYFKYI